MSEIMNANASQPCTMMVKSNNAMITDLTMVCSWIFRFVTEFAFWNSFTGGTIFSEIVIRDCCWWNHDCSVPVIQNGITAINRKEEEKGAE